MITAAIISPDGELLATLERTLRELPELHLAAALDHYPSELAFLRLVRARTPQLVIASTCSLPGLLTLTTTLESRSLSIPIIAVGRGHDPAALLQLLRQGIREYLPFPFSPAELQSAISRTLAAHAAPPIAAASPARVFSFLPAKVGDGATTVALHTAAAMTRIAPSPVLLADLDLGSGIVGFLLRLTAKHSMAEALAFALELDDALWRELTHKWRTLQVLPAGPLTPSPQLPAEGVHNLLEFARPRYGAICLDLSGNLEDYSWDAMQESTDIFLVLTEEPQSLHLAKAKVEHLAYAMLLDRVSVILNRVNPMHEGGKQRVEDLLGLPVAALLPDDPDSLDDAVVNGSVVAPACPLGRQSAAFARELLQIAALPPAASGAGQGAFRKMINSLRGRS